MPLRVDPTTAGDNWERGLNNASAKIEAGINRVQVSPGAKAAQSADKWLMSVTQAKDRFARGAQAVTLEDWRNAVLASVGNVGAGATRKKGKYVAKITPVFQHLAGVVARVDQMPSTTYEQRKARAVALMDGMHAYKG